MSASIDTGHISNISNQISLIQMFLKPEKQNKTKNNIDLRLIETISDLFLNICDKSNLQEACIRAFQCGKQACSCEQKAGGLSLTHSGYCQRMC